MWQVFFLILFVKFFLVAVRKETWAKYFLAQVAKDERVSQNKTSSMFYICEEIIREEIIVKLRN